MRVVSLRWLSGGVLFLLAGCGIDTSGGAESLDAGGAGGSAGPGGVSGSAGRGGVSGSSGQGGAGTAGVGGAGAGGAGTSGTAGVGGSSTCGNGVKDAGEACDPADPNLTCSAVLKKPATGTVGCTDGCATLDTSGCHSCGDGHRDDGEECDGTDLDGKKCGAEVKSGDGGTLGCTAQCTFDISKCSPAPGCNNGQLDPNEECDGAQIPTSCDQRHPGTGAQGTLTCTNCKITESCTFCGDGVRNNTEPCEGQDLGGATCADEQTGSPTCTTTCTIDKSSCKNPTCGDGKKNQGESDVDCGGATSCPRCNDSGACAVDGDCHSGYCASGKCAAPTCGDGVKNGQESDKDCGATCNDPTKKCATGLACKNGNDCQSNACQDSVCGPGTCADGILDNSETDVDCGGPNCVRGCDDGKSCDITTDCTSGNCATGGKCATAKTCTWGAQCTGSPCYGDYCLPVSNDDRLHASSCPSGWTSVNNSGCYLFVNTLATWYDAFRDCRDRGGNLAVLTDNNRLDQVGKSPNGAKINGGEEVWAGFACKNTGGTNNNDCANKNSWTWLENTTADSGAWGAETPNKDETCGYLRLRGSGTIGFGAYDCATKHTYLCERVP